MNNFPFIFFLKKILNNRNRLSLTSITTQNVSISRTEDKVFLFVPLRFLKSRVYGIFYLKK